MRTKFPRFVLGQVVILRYNQRPYKIRHRETVQTKVAQNSYVKYTIEGVADGTNIFYEEELRPLNDREIGADWSRA
jgi:hypothetical protein